MSVTNMLYFTDTSALVQKDQKDQKSYPPSFAQTLLSSENRLATKETLLHLPKTPQFRLRLKGSDHRVNLFPHYLRPAELYL